MRISQLLCQPHSWPHIAWGAHYTASLLAAALCVSVRHLRRRFHTEAGRSPQLWLDKLQIEAARKLLLQGKPVKAVASELGFKQPSHFTRKFKRFAGLTPRQFQLMASKANLLGGAPMAVLDNKWPKKDIH